MRTARRRGLSLAAVVLVILSTFAGAALADGNTIEVQVSPNVLNLQSKGGSLSLHTDLPFSQAQAVFLRVDGEDVTDISTFADDCGDLVVKAELETIKGMVSEPEATFELEVETPDGTFIGSDTIKVIDQTGEPPADPPQGPSQDPPKNRVMTLTRKMNQNRRNH